MRFFLLNVRERSINLHFKVLEMHMAIKWLTRASPMSLMNLCIVITFRSVASRAPMAEASAKLGVVNSRI